MSTRALVISLLSRIALNAGLMAESSSTNRPISTPAPRARRRAEMRQRDNERRCVRWVEKLRVLQASADQRLCPFSNLTEAPRAMPGAAQRSVGVSRNSRQSPFAFRRYQQLPLETSARQTVSGFSSGNALSF